MVSRVAWMAHGRVEIDAVEFWDAYDLEVEEGVPVRAVEFRDMDLSPDGAASSSKISDQISAWRLCRRLSVGPQGHDNAWSTATGRPQMAPARVFQCWHRPTGSSIPRRSRREVENWSSEKKAVPRCSGAVKAVPAVGPAALRKRHWSSGGLSASNRS